MVSNPGFSPDLFESKTVVITGAGTGIGWAAAQLFSALGASVLAHLGRNEHITTLPKNFHGHTADFSHEDGQLSFAEFVKTSTDNVDVLINNAGTMVGRFPADTLSESDYAHIVSLNQDAVRRRRDKV